MRQLRGEVPTATDAVLISQARLGDGRAFDVLARRHLPAIRLLTDLLAPGDDHAPLIDLTLETAYGTLRRMQGPTVSMRAFLLLLTRHLHLTGSRTGQSFVAEPVFSGVPFRDHQAAERHARVADAFARLPEGWQAAAWHCEAERDRVESAAAVLGVAPAGIPSLVASVRQELRGLLVNERRGYVPPACVGHTLRLARSGTATPPRSVLKHAAQCERCVVLVSDLDMVERNLGGVLARHLLGPVADSYLAVRRDAAASALPAQQARPGQHRQHRQSRETGQHARR